MEQEAVRCFGVKRFMLFVVYGGMERLSTSSVFTASLYSFLTRFMAADLITQRIEFK